MSCVFCKIVARELSASFIYEDRELVVFKDLNPVRKTHLLIIPKVHRVDCSDYDLVADADFFQAYFSVVKYLASRLSGKRAFNLQSNNGAEAGQTVFHQHTHFLSDEMFIA